MSARIDISGQRFGKLVASSVGAILHREVYWMCQCDCGKVKSVRGRDLRSGATTSCGCARPGLIAAANTTHGQSYTPTYKVWSAMKDRCSNDQHPAWEHYGGRGITVCERWMEFENFLADMGHPPEGLTLERNDVNGNYELANCRWASWSEQAANKRRSTLAA